LLLISLHPTSYLTISQEHWFLFYLCLGRLQKSNCYHSTANWDYCFALTSYAMASRRVARQSVFVCDVVVSLSV